MKKKIISIVLLAFVIVCLSANVLATSRFGYISDSAYVLSLNEGSTLAAKATEISEKHRCGVYMVTVSDMSEFGYTDALDFAESVYTQFDCGMGSERDGILLVLSVAGRDYGLISHGVFANTAFTDYGKDIMSEEFCSYFANDDWYGGFLAYIQTADYLLDSAESGSPVDMKDYGSDNSALFGKIAAVIIVPSLIALVVCLVFRVQMKSVHNAADATGYIPEKGVNMKVSRDVYTHTTESRRRLVSQTRSSDGGGNSGFSGKSGKF